MNKKPEFDWNANAPIPSLSALWDDNRSCLIELLRQNPMSPNYATIGIDDRITWKQRLIFINDSMRSVLLRNVLQNPTADGIAAKAALSKQQKHKNKGSNKQQQSKKHYQGGVPYPPNLGIVGTRVLLEAQRGINTTSSSKWFEEEEELDVTDGANVIIYFTRPIASQVRLVSSKIKALTAQHAKLQSANHNNDGTTTSKHNLLHRVVFLPHCTSLCERILLDEGILPMDTVSIQDLQLDLLPLDRDVLSMEIAEVISESMVEGCPSSMSTAVARSVMKMQDLCGGVIPRLMGIGPMGEAVVSQVMGMRLQDYLEEGGEEKKEGGFAGEGGGGDDCDIEAMLVLDRRVDLVTPMMTPLTYEGLIDEVIGIQNGYIQVDESLIDPGEEEENPDAAAPNDQPLKPTTKLLSKSQEKVALSLNGSDTLYAEVRNQNVEKFGSFLQDQAKALQESHSNFTNKEKDLTEIHQFVKQMPVFTQNLRSLALHIHLAEMVKSTTDESAFRQRWQTERAMVEGELCYDTIEDLIASQEPPLKLLRLLCLQSLTQGGLKSNKFDSLRREVVQAYGYEYLVILTQLEKLGLLRKREMTWGVDSSGSPFATLRKSLNLIHAEVNNMDPDDVSYVSSGYAPLTARLVQQTCGTMSGWMGKEEALKEIPGRLVDVVQQGSGGVPPEEFRNAMKKCGKGGNKHLNSAKGSGGGRGLNKLPPASAAADGGDAKKKPVLMVYYVGGVTFMEIAALRFLSKRASFPYEILVCTTKVINGNTLLQGLY